MFGKILVFGAQSLRIFLNLGLFLKKKLSIFTLIDTNSIIFWFIFMVLSWNQTIKLFPLVVLIGLFGPLCSKMPRFGSCFNTETYPLRKLDVLNFPKLWRGTGWLNFWKPTGFRWETLLCSKLVTELPYMIQLYHNKVKRFFFWYLYF